MRTAADLHGDVAYGVDLDHGVVSVAEDADRTLFAGFGEGHLFAYYVYFALYRLVDLGFDGFYLVGSEGAIEVEVEAQAFGGYVTALLLNFIVVKDFL